MKSNWNNIIFSLFMMMIWGLIMVVIAFAGENKRKARHTFLIKCFSPMSDSPEIIDAYNNKQSKHKNMGNND